MKVKEILFDCLLVAIGFAVIETIFRWYSDGGMTTIEQFILNFFYTPISIHAYRKIIPHHIPRIICFPLNIWAAELIMGYYLLYAHDTRVWYYEDEYAYFDGFITLSFIFYWIFLGFLVHIVFDRVLGR